MASLIIREAGQPDRIFHIQQKEIIIGRRQGAELVLPHVTVSREHAKIRKLGDLPWVERGIFWYRNSCTNRLFLLPLDQLCVLINGVSLQGPHVGYNL